ncbi:MAG TPA: hypothetical protein VHJ78_07005, partial [Actinomycetota bacterium]|nr:hypothetical protein [Actinomycetota bacterium]
MASAVSPPSHSPPELRAVGSAERALIVFRWVSLASMVINLLLNLERTAGRSPQLAGAAVAAVAVWTVYLNRRPVPPRGLVLAADVAIGGALLLLSGWVMPPGTVGTGSTLLSVTYHACAVLSAGAAYGPIGGALAGAVMGACHVFVRIVNGTPFNGEVLSRWPSMTGLLLLGLFFGVIANLLRRSSEEAQLATSE